jgi:hypothetical protein
MSQDLNTKDKEMAVKCDAGSFFFGKSFISGFIDGTTCASIKVGKLFLLSRIQIQIDNFWENINIFNTRVYTDKCFKSGFISIRAKMTKIKSIEVLWPLYTRSITFNTNVKASILVFEANASDRHVKPVSMPRMQPRMRLRMLMPLLNL